jgi:hypothetical protein
MAFDGHYIKVGGVNFPNYLIAQGGYSNTPDIQTDKGSYVNGVGELIRTILPVTRSTVKITTIDGFSIGSLLIMRAFFIPRTTVSMEYWNDEKQAYKTANFYVPEIEYVHIDQNKLIPRYKALTIEFIAYGGDTA